MTPELPIRYHCLRCGHRWLPRILTVPVLCPRCHSYKWQEPLPPDFKPQKGRVTG